MVSWDFKVVSVRETLRTGQLVYYREDMIWYTYKVKYKEQTNEKI